MDEIITAVNPEWLQQLQDLEAQFYSQHGRFPNDEEIKELRAQCRRADQGK